jgi:hypothetical protein
MVAAAIAMARIAQPRSPSGCALLFGGPEAWLLTWRAHTTD